MPKAVPKHTAHVTSQLRATPTIAVTPSTRPTATATATATPARVEVTNFPDRPDWVTLGLLVATLIAGGVAAYFSWRTYYVTTAKPKLQLAYEYSAIAEDDPTIVAIGVDIKNTGATTNGVYVDFWLEDPYDKREPHLGLPGDGQNRGWQQGDSMMHAGSTMTRYTRYFAQHILGRGNVTDLGSFFVKPTHFNREYIVPYAIRSADGSRFPEEGFFVLTLSITKMERQ